MSIPKDLQARDAAIQKAQSATRNPLLTTVPSFCNASQTAPYQPKPWVPARANADQHLQYKRVGF